MQRSRRVEGVERETELIARWAAGEWREAALLASDGQQYRVVYEGRRGGGAGPDFRDAVLACTDGARLHGDVELHLRAANWRAHGHERDPRYDGVVLHVVLAGRGPEPGRPPPRRGRRPPRGPHRRRHLRRTPPPPPAPQRLPLP